MTLDHDLDRGATPHAVMRVIHCGDSSGDAQRFAALAEVFGVAAANVEVRSEADLEASFLQTTTNDVVVVDVASLARVLPDTATQLRQFLCERNSPALLLVTTSAVVTSRYLESVTAGVVPAARAIDGSTGRVTFDTALSRELRGHSFARVTAPTLHLETQGEGFETVMTVDGRPTFGRITQPGAEASIFVWSTHHVFDVHRPLKAELELEVATDQYLPAVIFLKAAFGEHCWHAQSSAAGLVIDDALLQRRYGCIDFGKLLASARDHHYHVTVAFIPWNHWRTRDHDAALFREYSDVVSVCVHGNDHTKAEFYSENERDLAARVDEALKRMESHRERTGIAYEPLMVWPQERYSVQALRAVSASRAFLGVVNARCIPDDPTAAGQVRAADLLLPAQDSWFGIPILKRYCEAQGIANFALALFLGRPAILAEHHEYFRAGTDRMERFAAEIRRISPKARWAPLSETLTRLCWQRRISKNHWGIRFFADRFDLVHDMGETVQYELTTRVSENAVVERVTVNGTPVSFLVNGRTLQFRLRVSSRGLLRIAVAIRPAEHPISRSTTLGYRAYVGVRRALCEVRDNVVSRSVTAARVVRGLGLGLLSHAFSEQWLLSHAVSTVVGSV